MKTDHSKLLFVFCYEKVSQNVYDISAYTIDAV